MALSSSSSLCVRCLHRSINEIETVTLSAAIFRAPFSTTSFCSASPVKKTPVVVKPGVRRARPWRLSKKNRVATTRPPAVGERRTLRQRIVLSNSNALEVAGLQDLAKDNAGSAQLRHMQGSVLGFDDYTVDALRALGAFKPTQTWGMFRRPASLIRADTVNLASDFEAVEDAQPGEAMRKVVFGERGSGKSVLLLQALAMASLRGWILIHIPEAKDLTNAHTSYHPFSTPDGTLYAQPHYTAKLLERILKANQAILANLSLSKQHDLPVPLPLNTSLARLVEIGARDPEMAWPVWQALWSELRVPTQGKEGLKRPPIIFTVDAVDHVMRLSSYLNAQAEPIHAHELGIVRGFVDLLSGATALPNGGMVLAATSESNRAAAHTLDYALGHNFAIQTSQEPPRRNPYTVYDKWVMDAMKTVHVQRPKALDKREARGIMEYYARSGMLRSAVTDGLVSEKWTMAGGGIIGQIEKGTVGTGF